MAKTPSASAIVSLRLTQDERRLVEEAALKMGWKTAHFLRITAIERAAHILNLSRATSFDFSAVARRYAQALVAPRTVKIVDADPGLPLELGRFSEGPTAFRQNETVTLATVRLEDFSPAPLTADEVSQLQQAVHLGGAEFAAMVLAECRRLVGTRANPNLPAPIDPHNLIDSDEEIP